MKSLHFLTCVLLFFQASLATTVTDTDQASRSVANVTDLPDLISVQIHVPVAEDVVLASNTTLAPPSHDSLYDSTEIESYDTRFSEDDINLRFLDFPMLSAVRPSYIGEDTPPPLVLEDNNLEFENDYSGFDINDSDSDDDADAVKIVLSRPVTGAREEDKRDAKQPVTRSGQLLQMIFDQKSWKEVIGPPRAKLGYLQRAKRTWRRLNDKKACETHQRQKKACNCDDIPPDDLEEILQSMLPNESTTTKIDILGAEVDISIDDCMDEHWKDGPHFCPVQGCGRGPGGKGFKRKYQMIPYFPYDLSISFELQC